MDGFDRATALRDMRQALSGPPGGRTEALRALADLVLHGTVPPFAEPALALLDGLQPEVQHGWTRLRTRYRLRRVLRASRHTPDGFLLELNRRYAGHEDADRSWAEALLFEWFLDDLRRAYGTPSGSRRRTSRCLVLLDNVDSELGSAFMRLLLEARRAADAPDPLLVLAAAGSYPRALEDHAWGGTRSRVRIPGAGRATRRPSGPSPSCGAEHRAVARSEPARSGAAGRRCPAGGRALGAAAAAGQRGDLARLGGPRTHPGPARRHRPDPGRPAGVPRGRRLGRAAAPDPGPAGRSWRRCWSGCCPSTSTRNSPACWSRPPPPSTSLGPRPWSSSTATRART
ncbi:hypothetical protein NKH77_42200 [Streptomyces sp. M19]